MDLILLISAVVLGFFIGEAWTLFRLRHLIVDIAVKHGLDLEKELKKRENEVQDVAKYYIEVVNDGEFLLYEHDTNRFMCQAKSIDELAKIVQERNNINKAAVIYGKKFFMFLNGTAKELHI